MSMSGVISTAANCFLYVNLEMSTYLESVSSVATPGPDVLTDKWYESYFQ